ncbi:hypothetical protein THAOC_20300, partial [Thalassiosira oceanica]
MGPDETRCRRGSAAPSPCDGSATSSAGSISPPIEPGGKSLGVWMARLVTSSSPSLGLGSWVLLNSFADYEPSTAATRRASTGWRASYP